jgi:G:T-mismatch repair DNA endonuclease (very short patch repair protein)
MPRPRRRGSQKNKSIPWKIIRKHNRKRAPSSLEKRVHMWLEADRISFTKEKSIGRHLHVDVFFSPGTCIELNGCHWHGCMICNKELTKDQQNAQNKDARRYHSIRRLGYDVVIFWECEINDYPERVRDQLRALARRK